MKYIITESQYELLNESKITSIQTLVDSLVTPKYDFICKIVIKPPHYYNKNYSAHIFFKDLSYRTTDEFVDYYKAKDEVLDEVWKVIFNFTNEPVSLYKQSC